MVLRLENDFSAWAFSSTLSFSEISADVTNLFIVTITFLVDHLFKCANAEPGNDSSAPSVTTTTSSPRSTGWDPADYFIKPNEPPRPISITTITRMTDGTSTSKTDGNPSL